MEVSIIISYQLLIHRIGSYMAGISHLMVRLGQWLTTRISLSLITITTLAIRIEGNLLLSLKDSPFV